MPSLRTLDARFRPVAEAFFAAARNAVGGGLVVTSARRTAQEQDRLHRLALQGQNNGLPAAPAGHSEHELGLAFDMARLNREPLGDAILWRLGAAWRAIGGRWSPRDPVHFAVGRRARRR